MSLTVGCDSYVDQLNQILHYLGTPSEDTLRRVGSPRVRLLATVPVCVIHDLLGSRLHPFPPHQAASTLLNIIPACQPFGHRFVVANAML